LRVTVPDGFWGLFHFTGITSLGEYTAPATGDVTVIELSICWVGLCVVTWVTGFIPPGSEGVGSISSPDGGVDEPEVFGPPKIEAKNPRNMSTMEVGCAGAGCAGGGGAMVIAGVLVVVTGGSPPVSIPAGCRGVCTIIIVVISFGVFCIVT
jgi:hypothetical protein